MSRQGAAVQSLPQEPACEQEKAHAGQAQQKAVFYRAQDGPADALVISSGIAFGDHGQQHDGHGSGQGVGKKDHGEGHAREHAVHAEGSGIVIAIAAQPGGDRYGLHALQQVQHDPVGGEREDHSQQLSIAGGGQGTGG